MSTFYLQIYQTRFFSNYRNADLNFLYVDTHLYFSNVSIHHMPRTFLLGYINSSLDLFKLTFSPVKTFHSTNSRCFWFNSEIKYSKNFLRRLEIHWRRLRIDYSWQFFGSARRRHHFFVVLPKNCTIILKSLPVSVQKISPRFLTLIQVILAILYFLVCPLVIYFFYLWVSSSLILTKLVACCLFFHYYFSVQQRLFFTLSLQ